MMLIRTDELAKILDSQDLILVDARSFAKYLEGHIPGAVNLDLFAFHWIDTSESGIKSFELQTKDLFSFCGVTESKKVIFYDDQSSMLASRGVWMLTYLSHKDVHMLDGGMSKWSKEGRPTQTKPNGFVTAKFEGTPNPDVIAGYEYILQNIDRLTIIDARSPGEYDGSTIRAGRGGHIPHSHNIDFTLNISSDGTLKDSDELERLYQYPKDTEIVTYCQGAYRAANTFVALKKLGFTNVKVYLGSWGEWGNKPELPVTKH